MIKVGQDGIVRFEDMYLKSQTYTRPYVDKIDNIQQGYGHVNNGKVYANFSRPVDSGDIEDKSLRDCVTFQFPIKGGRVSNGRMQMHIKTPVRKQGICDILTECARPYARPVNFNVPQPINANSFPGYPPANQYPNQFPNFPHNNTSSTEDANTTMTTLIQQGPIFPPGPQEILVRPFVGPDKDRLIPAEGTKVKPDPFGEVKKDFSIKSDESELPGGCRFSTPDYIISWLYNEKTQHVEFSLSTALKPENFWTGIGFGRDMVLKIRV